MEVSFKFFKVRELYVLKGEMDFTCQENIRELYSFQFVSNDEKQKYLGQLRGL